MANNISEVALRLDNYPNLSVELGARFGDLAMQDSKTVNAFFELYQNRILFGTDFGNSKPDTLLSKEDLETELNNLDKDYQLLFNYLVKSDSIVVRNQKTKGLGLSENVLAKIFSENFFRILEN
jgi:predicted TIM-barrel fold metal-dependent hydrolase